MIGCQFVAMYKYSIRKIFKNSKSFNFCSTIYSTLLHKFNLNQWELMRNIFNCSFFYNYLWDLRWTLQLKIYWLSGRPRPSSQLISYPSVPITQILNFPVSLPNAIYKKTKNIEIWQFSTSHIHTQRNYFLYP